MKKSDFLLKTILSTFLASSLLGGSTAWAGELGYGFKPGLVAGKDFVEGQIIVGYREGASTQAVVAAARALGGTVKKEIPGSGSAVLLNFRSEAQTQAAIRQLVKRPDVLFVERNGIVRIPPQPQLPNLRKQGLKGGGAKGQGLNINAVSADPGTGFQYHLTVIRKTATLPALSATPPTVAVIDTGVDYTHPDLKGKVILGKNVVANNMNPFDDNGHGTHVAGIIAARAGNTAYGEGVCPNCKILAIKVIGLDGSGTNFDIADGMAYARTAVTNPPTKVVNMSLGGPDSVLISTQVDLLKAANKVLVAAAGNGNTTNPKYAFPGADPDTALRVMATEQNDCRAYFSNFSPLTAPTQYNIAAPGWKIPSTVPDLGFDYYSGTSMASPVVAGAAALVWGQLPTLTRDTLVARLLAYAKPIRCGFAATTKRLDVRKAILGTSETALIGRLLDPFTGKAPSPNTLPATAQIFSGVALLKSDSTDRGGYYEMAALSVGARTLKGGRVVAPAAYVNAALRDINILANVVNGPYTDALPTARPTGNATITLDWKNGQPIEKITTCPSTCNGWEFDLHVKSPSNVYFSYDNPGNLIGTPYITYPRDSLDSDGLPAEPIETIVIGSAAANGVYKIFVDNYWTGTSYWNDSWTNSLASVQMYNGAASIGTFAPPARCDLNRYWYVGNLNKNGPSYTWTNVNKCSNTKP